MSQSLVTKNIFTAGVFYGGGKSRVVVMSKSRKVKAPVLLAGGRSSRMQVNKAFTEVGD